MSKLYGKTWAEGNPGKISTRAAHGEITSQVLYGSAVHSIPAVEATVKYDIESKRYMLTLDVLTEGGEQWKFTVKLPRPEDMT